MEILGRVEPINGLIQNKYETRFNVVFGQSLMGGEIKIEIDFPIN